MRSEISLICAMDPLCGWCFGMIPAWRHLAKVAPDISVEVLPGGMWTGSPARAYSDFASMIQGAEVQLEKVTGRKPSAAFHKLIAGPVDAASERPGLAILMMRDQSPEHALEYCHHLQESHFADGADLNLAATYNAASDAIGAPRLDTDEILGATLNDPRLKQAFKRCAQLGPSGFPTVFAMNEAGIVMGRIPSTYDPQAFVTQVQGLVG